MTTFLGNDSVLKKALHFSLPYLLSYFLQTLCGMADLLIIGRFDGVAATTAVSIGSQVMHMSTVMLVGLAMGVTVGIGHAVGAGEQRRGGAHPVPCAECGKSFHGRRRGHCSGRVPGAYFMSKWFPDTLLPMGLATACGSVLSVGVCLIMYTALKKKGLFGVATR